MFTFIHPIKNTSHNCIFSADSIKSKWKSAGFRGDVCSTSLSAILTVASGSICSLHLSLPDKEETTQQTRPTGPVLHGGVAVIAVNGFLHNNSGDVIFDQLLGGSSFETLREQFQSALNSPNVSSIIFDVDSPGGEVSGCFDLVDEIYNARGIKPIYAVANEIAFAGAYAIASAAEKIFLPRTGGIGSVGVICVHVNQSKYDENIGVKFTPIYAGSHKADFDRHAPLSAAAQKARQDEINRIYELFVSTVARSCDRRVIIRNAATGWSVS
jgi:signal peptide peptidase SppA